MTEDETRKLVTEVKSEFEKFTEYSQRAQLDSFLSYYQNAPEFLHISSDGKMRNYEEFKTICTEYYQSLARQQISTTKERFHIIDTNTVIIGWTGNIIAWFRNGDMMEMNNYSVTNVIKRIAGRWKIIHSHESSLPPEMITKG